MSDIRNRQPVGRLKISDDVVKTIASVATLEIEGVDSIAQATYSMGKLLSKRFARQPIEVDVSDEFVEIDIQLILKFGAKITEVCTAVQNAIKESVQTMTGLAVSKVNVIVADIAFDTPLAQGE